MLGSHRVMGSLALCSANIQFPGNQLLLQLLKPGWQVFRPGCSRWNFVSLWEAPAIIWGLQGTRHLASVDRERVKLMESKQSSPSSGPQDWFTAQPVNMQATHPVLRIEPPGLKVCSLEDLSQLPQAKSLLLRILSPYKLGQNINASALSFIHCGLQLWQLFPSFTEHWWENIFSFSSILPLPTLFSVQKLNTCSYQSFRDHLRSCLPGQATPIHRGVGCDLFRLYSIWCELLKWRQEEQVWPSIDKAIAISDTALISS